jgi:cell division protein FtsQ
MALVTLLAMLATLAGGWIWFRNSPLVSVRHVTITGESGPDAAQIRAALVSAAHTMSTLNVQPSRLRNAVAPYPIVKDLRVTTQFPHGMRIRVVEQLAVAAVAAGEQRTAVAGDGTLLHDVVASPSLPLVPLRVPPGGARVTDPDAIAAITLLAASPDRLRGRISEVTTVASHGLVAQVRGGPSIYFGDRSELAAKWIAASEVLADPGSSGASYIDVTNPARPAAGAGSDRAGSSSDGVGANSPAAATTSTIPAGASAATGTGTTAGG